MIYQPSIYPLVGWFGWGLGNGQGQRPAHLQPAQLCRQEEQEDEPQGDFRQDAAQAQGFRIKFFSIDLMEYRFIFQCSILCNDSK